MSISFRDSVLSIIDTPERRQRIIDEKPFKITVPYAGEPVDIYAPCVFTDPSDGSQFVGAHAVVISNSRHPDYFIEVQS